MILIDSNVMQYLKLNMIEFFGEKTFIYVISFQNIKQRKNCLQLMVNK